MGFVFTEDGKEIIIGDPEKNIQQSVESIKQSVNYLVRDNKALRSQIKEFNKDAEIQAKDKELKSVRDHALCVMSDKESKARRAFVERHYKSCGNAGTYIYELSGTGIGTVIKIKCPVCGVEEDITDIDSW